MGKSTLVTQLAERVNISNILQTGIVESVMSGFLPPSNSSEGDELLSEEELIVKKYKNKSRWVRDGCNFDISKCFNDGKPLIIEGSHIDPECYCMPSPE